MYIKPTAVLWRNSQEATNYFIVIRYPRSTERITVTNITVVKRNARYPFLLQHFTRRTRIVLESGIKHLQFQLTHLCEAVRGCYVFARLLVP